MTLDEDLDTVREALGELLSTYGDHAVRNPLNMPAVLALARIELAARTALGALGGEK